MENNKPSSEQIAVKIIQATAIELGRALIQKNQARKSIRQYMRLTDYIKPKEGYDNKK